MQRIARERTEDPPRPLCSAEFWSSLIGLRVGGGAGAADPLCVAGCAAAAAVVAAEVLRRGYSVCGAACAPPEALASLVSAARALRDGGWPPAALLLADALWAAVLPAFDAAASILGDDCVVDESAFVFALSSDGDGDVVPLSSGGGDDVGRRGQALAQHRRCGQNFSLPHRDYTYNEAMDERGPSILSVWIPLTDATILNGCLYMVCARGARGMRGRGLLQHARAIAVAPGPRRAVGCALRPGAHARCNMERR